MHKMTGIAMIHHHGEIRDSKLKILDGEIKIIKDPIIQDGGQIILENNKILDGEDNKIQGWK